MEALLGEGFVGGAGTAVVGVGVDADAATGDEEAKDLDVAGLHELHQVVEDDVDAILVEVAVVAEGEEVELEALALHHLHIGDVENLYLGEVGLAGDGAQRGELGAVELHPVVALGVAVLEGLQHLWGVGVGDIAFVAEGLQVVLFSVHCLDFCFPTLRIA